MRRLPLVGLVVSAVADVVAVLLLIVIVERITSLPSRAPVSARRASSTAESA